MKQTTYLNAWNQATSFASKSTVISVKVSQREKAVFILDFSGDVVKVFPYDVLF